ncbi:hypothetical protein BGZ83_005544 [Gryganskiella cystojenkinii]|nr:hypothetical protein BGZ83_005544 [Gryganskiella cystojenkinii]
MDGNSVHLRNSRRSQQLSYFAPTTSSTSTQHQQQYPGGGTAQASSNLTSGGGGNSQAPVTPVDFTFPRRRHESVSQAGTVGGMGETTGVTYVGRRIAQAIILDGLENASQEVFAVILEMIITREINDRNRYVFPDLIVIAVFTSSTVPENIPKQLLDYFAINASYYFSMPQPRPQTIPTRRHALFRRTDWDELTKRMKTVTVSTDMMRYIRDVIVAVRTHEAVHGGLTARAALDLEAIMKTLSAIFQSKFVTPELLTIAAEKVFSHRLQLRSTRMQKIRPDLAGGSDGDRSSSNPSPNLPRNGKGVVREHQFRTLKQGQERYSKSETGGQSQRQEKDSAAAAGASSGTRKNSTESDRSSVGGASFVQLSDSESEEEGDEATTSSSNGSIIQRQSSDESHGSVAQRSSPHQNQQQKPLYRRRSSQRSQPLQLQGEFDDGQDSRTAADVVRDVLRVVYPPI